MIASKVTGSKVLKKSGQYKMTGAYGSMGRNTLEVDFTKVGIDTGYTSSSWGTNKTYVVECTLSGGVEAYTSQPDWRLVQWGVETSRVYSITRWSGGATIFFDFDWYTRRCRARASGGDQTKINWKLYELI